MTGEVLHVNTDPTSTSTSTSGSGSGSGLGQDGVLVVEKENTSAALSDKTNSNKPVNAASYEQVPTPTSKTDLDKRLKEETRRRVSALRAYQESQVERNDLSAKLKRALQVIDEHRDVINDLTAKKDTLRDELVAKKQEHAAVVETHHQNVQAQVTEKNELYKRVVALEDTLRVKEEAQAQLVKTRAIESGESMKAAAELSLQLKRLKQQHGEMKEVGARVAQLEEALTSSERRNLALACELNRTKAAMESEQSEFEAKLMNQMHKKSELNARAEKLMRDLKVEERRRASAVKEHAVKSGEMIGQIETMKATLRKLHKAEKPPQAQVQVQAETANNDKLVRSLREGLDKTKQELSTAQAELQETKAFATSLEHWLENTEEDQLKLAQLVHALEDQHLEEEKAQSSQQKDPPQSGMKEEIATLGRHLEQTTQDYNRATLTAEKLRKEKDLVSNKCAQLKEQINVAEEKISAMFREQQELVNAKDKLENVQASFSNTKKEMKQFKAVKEKKIQELVQQVKKLEQRLKEALSVNEFQAARLKQTYTFSALASVVAILVLALAAILGFYLQTNQ